MKNIGLLFIIFNGILILNSCSEDDAQPCPQTEVISMQINGQVKQFHIDGNGIDLDRDGSGHTLSLWLSTGVFQPQQDSYAITIKLPYKKTGTNIIEKFNYFRVQNGSSAESDFVEGELQSEVIINTNSCFSATFSGRTIVDGNEIVITEGTITHIYNEPFE
ncbi:hypothetical protein RM549_05145 [Salegentibacter sp. F188]|uniref:Uncharacterized protein n=1 Tax=Autumnicola patrickiae TaxID=3075591 RepID=A0ABU3E0F3_9FLAO|nr:hypothetical protein [Salegentibacter sp. F188]MDT0689159.1 hypothetical protein [Salegentibacter sp. F188]